MKIGIIGLGLIGGSLARVFKTRLQAAVVACNRSIEPLQEAFEEGMVDVYTTQIDESFSDCSIIFIATPVNKIVTYIEQLLPFVNADTIITDVGSTKEEICGLAERYKNDITFIGGHPMTGSERIGYQSSKEYMFENSYYILTPYAWTAPASLMYLENTLQATGALTLIMDAKQHDYATAAISHVPHVIAAVLVNMVEGLDDDKKHMYTLAAGGFRDITRIASASPEMWESICFENKENILSVIENFQVSLEAFGKLLRENDMQKVSDFFSQARRYRDSFNLREIKGVNETFDVIVDIKDKPGTLVEMAATISKEGINIKNIGILNSREREEGVVQVSFSSSADRDKAIALFKLKGYIYNVK